jgi:hypothetical protein
MVLLTSRLCLSSPLHDALRLALCAEAVHNSFIINDDCNESIITVNVKCSFLHNYGLHRPNLTSLSLFRFSTFPEHLEHCRGAQLFAQIRSENHFRKSGSRRFFFHRLACTELIASSLLHNFCHATVDCLMLCDKKSILFPSPRPKSVD